MHAYYPFKDDLDRHGLLGAGEILLFLVAAPLLLFPGKAAPLGLLLLFGQFAGRFVRQRRWLPPSSFNLPVGLFVLMAGVGYLLSTDRALSLNQLFVLLLGVGTFYTVMDYATTARRARHMAIALCIVGLSEPLIQRLERGIDARLALWPVAAPMVLDTPFTGSRLNNFPMISDLYSVTPIWGSSLLVNSSQLMLYKQVEELPRNWEPWNKQERPIRTLSANSPEER